MKFLDHLPQIIPVQMCIDFRGRNGLMAQHLLHSPKVSTAFNQMGSKRMPERMRTDRFVQSNHLREVFYDGKNHHPRKLPSISIQEGIRLQTLSALVCEEVCPDFLACNFLNTSRHPGQSGTNRSLFPFPVTRRKPISK